MSDVAAQSGSSIGSIYHHFAGKSELFLAIWDNLQESLLIDATRGVAETKALGVSDALALFQGGARAFFDGIWRHRSTATIFFVGDVPPEFASTHRDWTEQWLRKNSTLLRLGSSPRDRMLVGVYTSIVSEATREVLACRSRRGVGSITDVALEIVARLDPRRWD